MSKGNRTGHDEGTPLNGSTVRYEGRGSPCS